MCALSPVVEAQDIERLHVKAVTEHPAPPLPALRVEDRTPQRELFVDTAGLPGFIHRLQSGRRANLKSSLEKNCD